MKFSEESQFHITKELSEEIQKKFIAEYEAKCAISGTFSSESKEVYCQKKEQQFCDAMNHSQEQVFEGLMAFVVKDTPEFETIPLFKHLKRLNESQTDTEQPETIQELLEIDNANYTKLYNLASEELKIKNYVIASNMFAFLCWLNPLIHYALMGYGLAESLRGNYSQAKEIYEFCQVLAPDEPNLYLYMADNCYMMQDITHAKKFIDQAEVLAHQSNNTDCIAQAEQLKKKLQ